MTAATAKCERNIYNVTELWKDGEGWRPGGEREFCCTENNLIKNPEEWDSDWVKGLRGYDWDDVRISVVAVTANDEGEETEDEEILEIVWASDLWKKLGLEKCEDCGRYISPDDDCEFCANLEG
jgi:hypothetical protein